MKANSHYKHSYAPAYPNEADPGYFAGKLLDGITSAITGMGIVVIFIFLITM